VVANRQHSVLLVDDERVLADTVAYNFRREGYRVLLAADGEQGLRVARAERPNIIVLDIMLPRLDGFEVCRILRRETDVPILMLTAREGEADTVLGLELGADDYLTKPFSMRELLARVKAMLRRSEAVHARADGIPVRSPLEVGDLRIDATRHAVEWRGQSLDLTPKEFDLLLFFARHQGAVLNRTLLLERVWGYEVPIDTRTVDVHVRWLREKLEVDPSKPRHLQTVRGIGYRLVL